MTQRAGPTIVPDTIPPIGPYRILPVIGGTWALFDDRIDGPIKTAWTGKTLEAAKREAERLVKAGSPIANPSRPRLEVVRDEDDLPQRRRG